jgi:hypothetical protein
MPVFRVSQQIDRGKRNFCGAGTSGISRIFPIFLGSTCYGTSDVTLRRVPRLPDAHPFPFLLTPKIDRGDMGDTGKPRTARASSPVSPTRCEAKIGGIPASRPHPSMHYPLPPARRAYGPLSAKMRGLGKSSWVPPHALLGGGNAPAQALSIFWVLESAVT